MRWHSYQSLLARARLNRVRSTGILPVGPAGFQPAEVFAALLGLQSAEGNTVHIGRSNEVFRRNTRMAHRQDACATCD
jgi:hypothetical protein